MRYSRSKYIHTYINVFIQQYVHTCQKLMFIKNWEIFCSKRWVNYYHRITSCPQKFWLEYYSHRSVITANHFLARTCWLQNYNILKLLNFKSHFLRNQANNNKQCEKNLVILMASCNELVHWTESGGPNK